MHTGIDIFGLCFIHFHLGIWNLDFLQNNVFAYKGISHKFFFKAQIL